MILDILLIILAVLCLLAGLAGCVVPVIPGVPLAYLGLLLLHWTDLVHFSWQFLVIWAVVVIVVQVLDYIVPAWGTKKLGGTKWGVWGSTLGLLVGMFMGPLGIIIGPFAGAVLGELLYYNRHPQSVPDTSDNKRINKALQAGIGSFLGLLVGTVMKMVCCGIMIYSFVKELIIAL